MTVSDVAPKKITHPSKGRKVYLTTALRFGALIAAADDDVQVAEFSTLVEYFSIGWLKRFDARRTYLRTLSNPAPLRRVLKPFVATFGEGSAAAETFLIGMSRIAMADEDAHRREISQIRLAGAQLGLEPQDVRRILNTAGMIEDDEGPICNPEDWVGRARGPIAEREAKNQQTREQHIKVLGLEGDPKPAQIEAAYRALAAKYQPDAAGIRHMPKHEQERAAAIRRRIEAAYKALSR